METTITPKWRLAIGLVLFIFILGLVLARFTTNASYLDIGIIAFCSLLVIPCHLALSCYQTWFTWKRKLLIALSLFLFAIVTELAVHGGTFPFSDVFIILCFLVIATLCNVWFSKWNHGNIPLLPQLASDLCYMATWMLSFNLTGIMAEEDTRPALFSALSIIAILIAHFLLLGSGTQETGSKAEANAGTKVKGKSSTSQAEQLRQSTSIVKRFLMSAFMSLMLLIGLVVIIIIKAFVTL